MKIQVYQNEMFGQLRVVEEGGRVCFLASDVAKGLGFRDANSMTRTLDEDEKGTQIVRTPGGQGPAVFHRRLPVGPFRLLTLSFSKTCSVNCEGVNCELRLPHYSLFRYSLNLDTWTIGQLDKHIVNSEGQLQKMDSLSFASETYELKEIIRNVPEIINN